MYAVFDTLYMDHWCIVHSVLQFDKDCIPPPEVRKIRLSKGNSFNVVSHKGLKFFCLSSAKNVCTGHACRAFPELPVH